MDLISSFGFAIMAMYILIKDVAAPLVKNVMHKKTEEREPTIEHRVTVLEVNLTSATAQVTSFERLLDEQGTGLDAKMDIMLQELQEMRLEMANAHRVMTERLAKAETHIEHLLKIPRRSGD